MLKKLSLSNDATIDDFKAIDDETFNVFLDGYDGTTYNTYLVHVNMVRKFCGMKKLDRERAKIAEHEPIDLDECEAIYQKMRVACSSSPYPDRERALLSIMRYGGLREEEVVLLRAESFKFFGSYYKLHFYRPKTQIWADIVVNEGIADVEKYIKGCGDIPFDFLSHHIWRIVKDIAVSAGVKWNPHKFRHFRATEMGKTGRFTKWDLDNFFGWKHSSNTASVYVNLSPDETNKKVMEEAGIVKKIEPKEIAERRCRRCAAVLGKDEIASGRCPVCQASTNQADFVAELKARENLEAQVSIMQRQMSEMMAAMQKMGAYPAKDLTTGQIVASKE